MIPSFICMLIWLMIFHPAAHAKYIYAAEPGRVTLSCDEAFYDPATRSLSVNALLPDGQRAMLIAASFFPDGRMKEKVVRTAENSGTYTFPFTRISNSFRIFASDPDTLSPLTKDLAKIRNYTASEVKETTTVLSELSMRSQQTATALCAMTADLIEATNAFDRVRALASDTVEISGKPVTKLEAVYGNEEAYQEALATVSSADVAYDNLEYSAGVLSQLEGYSDSDEDLETLSGRAGIDVIAAKAALSEIRVILDNKYAVEDIDTSGFSELCDEVCDGAKLHVGAGSKNLFDRNILITGAPLAVLTGERGSALIIEPFNGKLYEDAGISGIPEGSVYAAGKYGETVRLADILSLDGTQRSSYDRYEIEAQGESLKATVTSLANEEITEEELKTSAEAYFEMNSLGEHTVWDEAAAAFVSEFGLNKEQLAALPGVYTGALYAFSNAAYSAYYEDRGYHVTDRSNYVAYNNEYRRTRYITDGSGNYVGYYEEWVNECKTREAYYSENRSNGLHGLIYEKWWDPATGYLAGETTYSKGMPEMISGSGELSAGGAGAEGAAGAEEAAGEVPASDGKLFRRERHYWIRDAFGEIKYNGQIEDEVVYQWRQDFYDEYMSKNPDDPNGDSVGWFEIAYRFYYPSGKISMERMAMQSGTALRERNYTEEEELSQEKWYLFNNETFKFRSNHYALFSWYTKQNIQSSPALSRFTGEMASDIQGHPMVRFDSLNGIEDYYTPGMWNARWEKQGEDTWVPIPGTIETYAGTEQFWEYDSTDMEGNYLKPSDFDYEGWEHSTGSGGSKSYDAVTTHYQYDKHNQVVDE